MTYLEAAIAVLKRSKRPLTAGEIVSAASSLGLIEPAGKTPHSTMSARLYVESITNPQGAVQRIFESGPTRARRGSVRWTFRS